MTGINLDAWNPYTFPYAGEVVTLLVLIMLAVVMAGTTLMPCPHRKKLIVWPLLLFWIFTILSATFFGRLENGGGGHSLQLKLFWTVQKAWAGHDGLYWYYIIGNILLFVPFGFLLPLADTRMQNWLAVTFAGAVLSLLIELTQYVTGTGLCELDDLFHNTWGTFIGYQVFLVSQRRRGEGWLSFLYLIGICLLFATLLHINMPDWTGIF